MRNRRTEKVYWQSDDQPKELNFFSISSDGRVASWVMSKNELKMEPVMQLKLVNTIKVSIGRRPVGPFARSPALLSVYPVGGARPLRFYSRAMFVEA